MSPETVPAGVVNSEGVLTAVDVRNECGARPALNFVELSSSGFTFDYEGATIGPKEYISAMIVEVAEVGDVDIFGIGVVTHYGRIAQPTSSSGRLTINFPDDNPSSGYYYYLFIFSEENNGISRQSPSATEN